MQLCKSRSIPYESYPNKTSSWYVQVVLPALVANGGPFEPPPAYVFRYLPAWWELRACLLIQNWRNKQAEAQAQANEYFARVKFVATTTFLSQPPTSAPVTSSLQQSSTLFTLQPPASAPAQNWTLAPAISAPVPASQPQPQPQPQPQHQSASTSSSYSPAPARRSCATKFSMSNCFNLAPLGPRPTQTTVSNFSKSRS